MKISKQMMCELIVRSYATKYLGKGSNFDLDELQDVIIKDEPKDEFYSSAALVKALIFLGLFKPDSALIKLTNLDATIMAVSGDLNFKISFDDIIESLPLHGSTIRKCKLCGKIFVSNYNEREEVNEEYCDNEYMLNFTCRDLACMDKFHIFETIRKHIQDDPKRNNRRDSKPKDRNVIGQEITCEGGAKVSIYSLDSEDDIHKKINADIDRLYTNGQKALWMKKRRKIITDERYQIVKADMLKFRNQVKAGSKTLGEFNDWIKSNRT